MRQEAPLRLALGTDATEDLKSIEGLPQQHSGEQVTRLAVPVGSINAASGEALLAGRSTDPDLAIVVRHWPDLLPAVQMGIVAMVRASVGHPASRPGQAPGCPHKAGDEA